tara:strand:+ start:472 stop:654 length:183 start_codon:yes stop_codon:yes gene_type:complete
MANEKNEASGVMSKNMGIVPILRISNGLQESCFQVEIKRQIAVESFLIFCNQKSEPFTLS